MATKLFLRNTTDNGITDTGDGVLYDMGAAGAASDTLVVDTAASGTEIQWTDTAGGLTAAFISGRAPTGGFTLTTTDISVWAEESHMNANAGGRFRVFKRTAAGVVSEVAGGPFNDGVEFAVGVPTEMLWAGDVTDTAFAEDDRILLRVYITNVGTMAGAFTCTLTFNAADAVTGDSFFNIAETVTFKANEVSATATPSTVAAVATIPTPTVLADAIPAVSVVACVATVPTPTIEATGGAALETGWDEWGRFYTANNSETGRIPVSEDQVSETGDLLYSLAILTIATPATVGAVATVPAVTVSGTVEIDTEDIIATVDIPQPAIQIIPAPQKVRPDADQSIGTWTTDTGGTTNLWDALNEAVASDTDYVKSAVNPTNNELIVTLTNIEDPLSSTGHEIRFRRRKT